MEQKPALLINLVKEAIQEKWPDRVIKATYYEYDRVFWALYIDYMYIGEVYEQTVKIWSPAKDGDAVCPKRDTKYNEYLAADPKFFTQIFEIIEIIMQHYENAAEETLRNAQYFNTA